MPCYSVVIHATGIAVASEGGGPDIVGFYRLHCVRAPTATVAQARALAAVAADWDSPRRALSNHGARPSLSVEQVDEITLWDYLRRRNGGHLFYPPDDDEDESSTPSSPC